MKFFIDNNLSDQISKGMQGFGENVVHLKDLFKEDSPDTEWLSYIGKNRIFLITRDLRIRWRPGELISLNENNVGAFFLAGKNRKRCELIQQLVRNWPRIKEFARKTSRPFAFRVPPSGTKITKILLN